MTADLFVLGSSGLAKEVAFLARTIDPNGEVWPLIHYVSDKPLGDSLRLPFGDVDTTDDELLNRTTRADVVIGIGNPAIRRRLISTLGKNPNLNFPNLIHPQIKGYVGNIALGIGNVLTQGVAMTCEIIIKDFNLFNLNSTFGHDCRIGSYNVFNPGSNISGCVNIGDECLIGTGACVLEGLHLENCTTVGAGAVLTKSTNGAGKTFVGVPARSKV